MRLQRNLVLSLNSTVPPLARPSYQPSLKMTCTNVPAAACGCSDHSTRRCTVVHFRSRYCNSSESNEATALEITGGAWMLNQDTLLVHREDPLLFHQEDLVATDA